MTNRFHWKTWSVPDFPRFPPISDFAISTNEAIGLSERREWLAGKVDFGEVP
jgi:hypothetical protein